MNHTQTYIPCTFDALLLLDKKKNTMSQDEYEERKARLLEKLEKSKANFKSYNEDNYRTLENGLKERK